ncbi:PAT complex subunit CCDC47 [Anthonomus grandis grandis]|uniref:PAT complex subunit CCDC47 n=1 Tax=Anthonomus grandis grandis TaxID=2921223 RepID=UPI002165091A|nr:PAT complex subunit CCDC47 [Anthonomus grandis grandis]
MLILKLLYLVVFIKLVVANIEEFQDDGFTEFDEFEEPDPNFFQENEFVERSYQDKAYSQDSSSQEENQPDIEIEIEHDEENEIETNTDIDSEFEHFQDADEFEGFEEKEDDKPLTEPKITIAKIPVNFIYKWESYYLEMLMVAGLLAYFINFALGRTKNTKIATTWFQTHRQLLEENFAMVGDDGGQERGDHVLIKESENVFTLWCSGRTCCEGMLVELRLIKRHDLVALIANAVRPTVDQVHITVRMNKDDMDSFVFAVASKKTAILMSRDLQDISVYCPDRKPGDKFNLPAGFQVMSEIGEVAAAFLDLKITAILNKYTEYIDYIHLSDQYSGIKPSDDANPPTRPVDKDKVLRFGFNLSTKGMGLEEVMTKIKPLMSMVFYCIDKTKRYRLSKEGKTKADKNRQRVEEAFLKSTHQARAEAAAAKREEKRKLEKEKVLAEEDPEKQRRWELKEEKRQAKKRAPRMRQLKVKAL